jgi:ferrous iron transport protein B
MALRAALDLSKGKAEKPPALAISYGPDIDAALMEMCPIIEKNAFLAGRYPARWVALKYLERDSEVMAAGQAAMPETAAALCGIAEETARHLRATLQSCPEAVIADYRYGYISALLRKGVFSNEDTAAKRLAYSDAADKLLTHRILGPCILMLVLYGMYWLTFALGEYPKGWLESGIAWIGEATGALLPDGLLNSLITSGIIQGVGSVLSFVPLIAIMFLLISVLEDSGYMARIAYMMDRVFRIFGLHGASVMPFVVSGGIAGGCAIPGIMATRTLRSPKERLATMLTLPYMTCGAKLPVFLLFVGIFFHEDQALVMFLLTLAGWCAALIIARVLRSTLIRGEATPFVMELPPYRMPVPLGVCIHAWERIWQYIKKAGTIILAVSVLVWAAMTFPGLPEDRAAHYAAEQARVSAGEEIHDGAKQEALNTLKHAEKQEALRSSLAGRLGIALEPATRLAGFDWRANIALLAGISAKEVVVSTLGTVYSLGEVDTEETEELAAHIRADEYWNTANAVALLLFTLLYSPCFAALAVIRNETNQWRWMFFSLFFNLAVAFGVSATAYQLLRA